jgi:hypothetical protein
MCVSTRCTGCMAAAFAGAATNCVNMDWGADPRGFCPYQDICHLAFCAGDSNLCDHGFDQAGNFRPCGAVTCTSDAKGTGSVSGYLCNDAMGCQPAQAEVCAPILTRSCYPCLAPNGGCDPRQPHSC